MIVKKDQYSNFESETDDEVMQTINNENDESLSSSSISEHGIEGMKKSKLKQTKSSSTGISEGEKETNMATQKSESIQFERNLKNKKYDNQGDENYTGCGCQ
ncbi:PREDICTED: uncharacterized protein LOC107168991 [Diuraphis noxia]|uniref:uncharacterized protein LOC107168991 n=1 Tax=Diuraphis noxia TaxID=143948 RepID=UPI000763A0BE|nr:PREDICTED: uncharacterized protein LOC107168991 [Diuraphis noxia]